MENISLSLQKIIQGVVVRLCHEVDQELISCTYSRSLMESQEELSDHPRDLVIWSTQESSSRNFL